MMPGILVASVVLLAAGGASEEPSTARTGRLAPGDAAELSAEGCTSLEVVFREVLADSRCPEGVQCFWAGDVEVEISLRVGESSPEVLSLHTHRGQREREVDGCFLRIASVEPPARSDGRPSADDYRVRFELGTTSGGRSDSPTY